jgi:DNA polymerase-3 subunit delta'
MAFKDIKGQNQAIEILKRHLRSQALKGAYLFIGEEGIGKYLVAKTFAKAVNCLKNKDDACDSCISCLKIKNYQHPDVYFIEPQDSSETIKIEEIRGLKKNINLKAYEAKNKVFIINDAHNLSAEASNALLKILEEPPKDSLIILISAKPALLFKTIISRCQILKFYPLKRQTLEETLKKEYHLDNISAHFLGYFCEGRVGCALRFKDEDILRQKNRIIDEFTHPRLGILEKISINENNIFQNKENVRLYFNILATWIRDLYLIKIGMPHSELINADRRSELLRSMSRYTLLELEEMLKSISDSLWYLEQNINVKLLLSNLREDIWKG